jgi:hypothetical protein
MVIGDKFIWAHIGKTGGDSVTKMFDYCTINVIKDDTKDPNKHRTFLQIENLKDIDRIATIRRLPLWMLSRVNHTKIHQNVDFTKDEVVNGIIKWPTGSKTTADQHLLCYQPDLISCWLRTEFLANDFINIFSKYFIISNIQRKKIMSVFENKRQSKDYMEMIKSFYTLEDVKHLYDVSPTWSKYEKMMYGNLMYEI